MSAHKVSFVPDKPIIVPFAGEGVVSYGDRLLWHQLALQLNNHHSKMLTQNEYVSVVLGFYPDAVKANLEKYPGYFNRGGDTNGMGFRQNRPVPEPLELPK